MALGVGRTKIVYEIRGYLAPSYFILIIFLDNSLILSDRAWSLPSILTSKYMLRSIGNPTEAIRVWISESIINTTFQ